MEQRDSNNPMLGQINNTFRGEQMILGTINAVLQFFCGSQISNTCVVAHLELTGYCSSNIKWI